MKRFAGAGTSDLYMFFLVSVFLVFVCFSVFMGSPLKIFNLFPLWVNAVLWAISWVVKWNTHLVKLGVDKGRARWP